MSGKSAKKPPKKRQAPPPPPASRASRTLGQALVSMREFAYAAAGCAVIAGVMMLLHMRPFG